MLNTIIRYLFVILYSTAVVFLVIFTMPDDVTFTPPIPKWIFVVLYYGIFILNSEVNFYYDRYLNKTMPWFYFPRKRILVQTGFILGSTLLIIGSFFTTWFILNGGFLVYPPFSVLVFISSVVLLVGFFGISVAINSSREWKTALLEVKHLEQEKLKSDYKILQDQLNPHFLFNSLNALIAEIKHDPETAIAFTRGLSQVYRYVLQSKNYEIISLRKELDFYPHLYLFAPGQIEQCPGCFDRRCRCGSGALSAAAHLADSARKCDQTQCHGSGQSPANPYFDPQ